MLEADVPLRCCVSAASPADTEVFFSYSERFELRRQTALAVVWHAESSRGPLVVRRRLDSIFKKPGQIWTPLRIDRLFCAVTLRRSGEAERWIRWSYFLRCDSEASPLQTGTGRSVFDAFSTQCDLVPVFTFKQQMALVCRSTVIITVANNCAFSLHRSIRFPQWFRISSQGKPY